MISVIVVEQSGSCQLNLYKLCFQAQIEAFCLVDQCAHAHEVHACFCKCNDSVEVDAATGFGFKFLSDDLRGASRN